MPTRQKAIGIIGTGSYLPEKVLTNFDLEKIVDTSDAWIRAKTGITKRHIANKDEASSDLGVKAAQKAIEAAGLEPKDIDIIVVATSTPDRLIPATACIIQDKLGINGKAFAFDVNAVCSGFVYGLHIVSGLLLAQKHKRALLVATETYSRIIDWKDRTSCVYFGDGAGAVVCQAVDEGGIIASYLRSDGSGRNIITIPAGGSEMPATEETVKTGKHYFKMDGKKILNFAINAMVEAVEECLKKANIAKEALDWIIPHQANINIIMSAMDKLNIPREKAIVNIHKVGNLSAASIPVALDEAVKEKKIKKGDVVVFVGFGGGLTWGANVIIR